MLKKKRFQQEEWDHTAFNKRLQREQRVFLVTVVVAVAISAVAFSISKGNHVLHLPFHSASTAANP